MSKSTSDESRHHNDLTLPSKLPLPANWPADAAHVDLARPAASAAVSSPPWLLQHYFENNLDLASELTARYPNAPLMTIIKTRGEQADQPPLANLSAPDGTASLIIEARSQGHDIDFAFTTASMLTLRFRLRALTAVDCAHWLGLMRRDKDGIAFLWGERRWEHDYCICIIRRHFAHLYAFSNHGFEAAVRLTQESKRHLHDWLATLWNPDTSSTGVSPNLLTW